MYENDIEEQMNFKRWRKFIGPDYSIRGHSMPSHDKRFLTYLAAFERKNGRPPAGDDIVLQLTGSRVGTVQYIKVVDPKSSERVGYPTQKPLALLRRIVAASSNEGDIVLDPFAGCATACIAAEDLGRQWVGIDISAKAAELVRFRLYKEVGWTGEIAHRTDVPKRTDLGRLPPYRSHKPALYGSQSGDCAGCGEHFEARHLEVDHIIARGKGGTDHIDNLQLLCGSCNRIKGDRGMDYLRVKLQL